MILAINGAVCGKSGITICVVAGLAGKSVMLVAVTVFAGSGMAVWPVCGFKFGGCKTLGRLAFKDCKIAFTIPDCGF